MKKKFLLCTFFVFAFICLLAISSFAVEINDVHYTLNVNDKTAQVSAENQASTKEIITIPSTVEYDGAVYNVTSIESAAFRYNKTVKEIRILSEYITQIPYGMIADTYDGALERVYIDFSRITSIGGYGLNNSNIRNDNTPIGTKRVYFYDADVFAKTGESVLITNPDFSNCVSLGGAAFQRCATFETVVIPATTKVDIQVFREGTIVDLIVKGEERERIENYTYNNIDTLKTIVIESKALNYVGDNAFGNSHNVESIKIDLSSCVTIGGGAFSFNDNYQNGVTNVWTKWYNLEGERLVDLSSVEHLGGACFGNCNLGGGTSENQWAGLTKIVWPKALKSIGTQVFRRDNLTGLIYLNAAEGSTLNLEFWAFNGNRFDAAIFGTGVTTINMAFEAKCTAVFLADSVSLTQSKPFNVSGSVLYCKELTNTTNPTNVTINKLSNGTINNYGACGVVADLILEDGSQVSVGEVVHTTIDAINDLYCPKGKVTETTCKYCDYVAYSVDGEAVEKKEHSYVLVGSITYTDYFQMGYKTNKCECGAEKSADEATEMALFIDYGYSATEEAINGKYSMVQVYGINDTAYKAYVEAGNTLEYGLVVSVVNNPLDESQSDLIATNKTYIAKQSFIAHDYFEIGIVGIGEGQTDARLTFCAYVIDNGEVFYLDGGKTLTEATQKCYDDIKIQTER